jgi:hypothetical protein
MPSHALVSVNGMGIDGIPQWRGTALQLAAL